MSNDPSLEDVRDALQRNPGLSLGECVVRMERAEARVADLERRILMLAKAVKDTEDHTQWFPALAEFLAALNTGENDDV